MTEIQPEEKFDDELLEIYMRTFYGFGTYSAAYWLIGIEEGGGESFSAVQSKLKRWHLAGRPELMAIRKWTKIQATWGRLIRILLAARGRINATREEIMEFQTISLGQPQGEAYLVELLPLPSPSTSQWIYAEYSRNPVLSSRKVYEQNVAHWRADALRSRISLHKPQAVLFYGSKHRSWWSHIAGAEFKPEPALKIETARADGVTYVSMPHPLMHGLSTPDFEAIGTRLRQLSNPFYL